MNIKKATKTINYNDRWEEFKKSAIDVLTGYLSDDMKEQNEIHEIKNKQVFSNQEFMRLYKIIYDLCIIPKGNFAKTLYTKYVEVTTNYLLENVLPGLSESSGIILLKRLANHWDKHVNIFVKWLGKWFRYLDQHYVQQFSLEKVSEKGESLFRVNVFLAVKVQVLQAIMQEFEKEREGEIIDYSTKTVIDMIIKFRHTANDDTDFYKELEDLLVKETSRYYSKKGIEFLKDYSWAEYLHMVNTIIEQEKYRIEKYMTESSFDKYIAVVQDELLVKNMNALFAKGSGLSFILKNHVVKEMKLIYKLFCPLQHWLKEIAQQFKIYISEEGNRIVDLLDEEVAVDDTSAIVNKIIDSQFVDEIINFCERYVSLLIQDFRKDTYFVTSFESAFGSFLNRSVKSHTIAEILARSCEKVLKKGNQLPSEHSIHKYIQNITNLFSYMEDKDLFIEVYKCGLAKRLLDNKWASLDYEKEFIGKIKMSWGPQYTSKVEGMLTDINNEANFINDFKKTLISKGLPVEFDVKILTDGYWPSFKTPPVILPSSLNNWVETFNKYYTEKNKMKHLQWSYMHGSCVVKANFDGTREYDLILTTYQTAILMLFNDNESLTIDDIKNELKTEESLVRNMIISLSSRKYKILLKTGDEKEVSREDIFTVNEKFKSKLKLITVAAPTIKETFNKEKVDIDRSHAIEAAIVKIMKSRKKMTYMHLSQEVMIVLQMFKPTASMVKSKIEALIDRDYLERDAHDVNIMRYKA